MFICKISEKKNLPPLPIIENYQSYSPQKSSIEFKYNPECIILDIGETHENFSVILGSIFNVDYLCRDIPNLSNLSTAQKIIFLQQRDPINFPNLLKGSFILLIINKNNNNVLVIKSPLNRKHLFFSCNNGCVYLSTSVPLIKRSNNHVFQINENRIIDLQARAANISDTTFYTGIDQIEGGSIIEIKKCSDVSKRLFFTFKIDTEKKSYLEYAENLNKTLEIAIKRNIRTGDNILCEMSGGLDSSSIAARLAQYQEKLTCISNHSTEKSLIEVGIDPRKSNEKQLNDFENFYKNTKIIRIDERFIECGYQDITKFCFENSSGPEYGITNALWVYAFYKTAKDLGFNKIFNGSFGDDAYSYPYAPAGFIGFIKSKLPEIIKTMRQKNKHKKLERSVTFSYLQESTKNIIRNEIARNSKKNRQEKLYRTNFSINSCSALDTALFNSTNIEMIDPLSDADLIECCLRIPENAFYHGAINRYITRISNHGILPESIRSNFIKGAQSPRWHVQLRKELPYYFSLLQKFRKNDLISKITDLEQLERCMKYFSLIPENTIKNYPEIMWLPYTLHICEWISLHD